MSRDPAKPAGPRSVADALGEVLGGKALERAEPIAEIGARWEALVGEEVAAHCRPAGMKAGVLFADVDSSVWCQQLQLRSPEILAALRRGLGEAAPTDLRLRVGYARSSQAAAARVEKAERNVTEE